MTTDDLLPTPSEIEHFVKTRKLKQLVNVDISEFDPQLRVYLSQDFGLGRLFRWLRARTPLIGESIVLAHILRISAQEKIFFPERTIRRVIREFEEKDLDPEAKAWLVGLHHIEKGNRFQNGSNAWKRQNKMNGENKNGQTTKLQTADIP